MTKDIRILRKIRKEFDYQEYLELNFSVKYSGSGELRICCPNCGDGSYKLYVNNQKKVFNCFKCDFNIGNYDVFDFVATCENISRPQAQMRLMREFAEVTPDWHEISFEVDEHSPEAAKTKIKALDGLPKGVKPLNDPNAAPQQRYWKYLLERGFTEGEVRATKAHYVPVPTYSVFDANKKNRGNIGHRILFPVYGGHNELVSWLARSIDGTEPKYFNAPDSEASRTLWPYVPLKGQRAVIVEGLIDALAVRRQGFAAYATLGKKISYDQIELLKRWNVTSVVLSWDKKDAKKEMVKAIDTLKLHFDEVLVPDYTGWPTDKDPGDTLNWEEGETLLKDMLSNKLIDVNSLEFAAWNLT